MLSGVIKPNADLVLVTVNYYAVKYITMYNVSCLKYYATNPCMNKKTDSA